MYWAQMCSSNISDIYFNLFLHNILQTLEFYIRYMYALLR